MLRPDPNSAKFWKSDTVPELTSFQKPYPTKTVVFATLLLTYQNTASSQHSTYIEAVKKCDDKKNKIRIRISSKILKYLWNQLKSVKSTETPKYSTEFYRSSFDTTSFLFWMKLKIPVVKKRWFEKVSLTFQIHGSGPVHFFTPTAKA